MVTSSYSAKKGTHVTSYTLLLHEKNFCFYFENVIDSGLAGRTNRATHPGAKTWGRINTYSAI